MNHFSLPKTLLVALVAIGGLSSLGASEANAGWYGRRCYTPSYSTCSPTIYRPVTYSSYSNCSPTYYRTYSPSCSYDSSYSTWSAPTYYAPVTISSYHNFAGSGCYTPGYGGGYSGYGFGGCYATPASYGQCGW
ncbi:hypothetical protein ACFL2H_10840 [Planctomycetota bacterium]